MDVQRWICGFSNTKTKFVKIVHPGGHVELHDRPVLASEILNRNPRTCVAHPNIFRQPWAAVVEPETTLMPGQKFYVVPQHTLQRLQSLSLESSSISSVQAEFPTPQENNKKNTEKVSTCGLLFRRIIRRSDDGDDEIIKCSWSSLGSCEMKALRRNKGGDLDSS